MSGYLSKCSLLAFVVLVACKHHKDEPGPQVEILNQRVGLNPSGYSPLTGLIDLETSFETRVSIRVVGKHGTASDVVKEFDDLGVKHTIPVMGLYAEYDNTVEVSFRTATGADAGKTSFFFQTNAIPDEFQNTITINKTSDTRTPGMTLVSYFGYTTNPSPQRPFIFDEFGDIRWYLDFTIHPQLANLFYDDGMERLQNGNLYFGDGSTGAIYELDMLGKVIDTWPLTGYSFHHNVFEKPDGNFLVTVTKQGSATIEDYVIEIDRATKEIIRTWDLNQSLQYSRQALTTDAVDWIHVNAVTYDASDSTIIISGRTQALVKLDRDNHVVWILGCHRGWGQAGDGTDLTTALLQPLDQVNQPINDADVLDGDKLHADFEWNWYQHAPLVMPNGHVMLFDNGGGNREFSGGSGYSRAVEFDVNKANKTVRQVWEYGKERGAATSSTIVSDVDFLPSNNHVIFSPGAVSDAHPYGKEIEVDYATGEVLFEATITPAQSFYGITFHRTERMSLYP